MSSLRKLRRRVSPCQESQEGREVVLFLRQRKKEKRKMGARSQRRGALQARQVSTLIWKNVVLVLFRHAFSTPLRCFLLPVIFTGFLAYARNVCSPFLSSLYSLLDGAGCFYQNMMYCFADRSLLPFACNSSSSRPAPTVSAPPIPSIPWQLLYLSVQVRAGPPSRSSTMGFSVGRLKR